MEAALVYGIERHETLGKDAIICRSKVFFRVHLVLTSLVAEYNCSDSPLKKECQPLSDHPKREAFC